MTVHKPSQMNFQEIHFSSSRSRHKRSSLYLQISSYNVHKQKTNKNSHFYLKMFVKKCIRSTWTLDDNIWAISQTRNLFDCFDKISLGKRKWKKNIGSVPICMCSIRRSILYLPYMASMGMNGARKNVWTYILKNAIINSHYINI